MGSRIHFINVTLVEATNMEAEKNPILYANPDGVSEAAEGQASDNPTNKQRFANALIKDQWRMLNWVNSDTEVRIYVDGQEQVKLLMQEAQPKTE